MFPGQNSQCEGESFKQTLPSPDSTGDAQKAEQRCSAALPQHKYTEGLVSYLTDSHDKGFGQEVLGCMCPMK